MNTRFQTRARTLLSLVAPLAVGVFALSVGLTGCMAPLDESDSTSDGTAVDAEQVGTAEEALTPKTDDLPNGASITVVFPSTWETAINHEIHQISGLFRQDMWVQFPQFQGAFTSDKFFGCQAAFANFNIQKRHSGGSWVHVTGAQVFATPHLVIDSTGHSIIVCDTIHFAPFDQGTSFQDGSDQALFQIDTGTSGLHGNMSSVVSNDLSHSP